MAGAWLDSFAITKCETIDIPRLLYSDYELGVIENRGALKTTSASKTILGAAKFLGIGTVVVQCHDSNRTLRLRGIKDPEIVETKLRALLPASSPVFTQVP